MHTLGYRWTIQPGGQYVDVHKRVDVVDYCQNVFLPVIQEVEFKIRAWKNGTNGYPLQFLSVRGYFCYQSNLNSRFLS